MIAIVLPSDNNFISIRRDGHCRILSRPTRPRIDLHFVGRVPPIHTPMSLRINGLTVGPPEIYVWKRDTGSIILPNSGKFGLAWRDDIIRRNDWTPLDPIVVGVQLEVGILDIVIVGGIVWRRARGPPTHRGFLIKP